MKTNYFSKLLIIGVFFAFSLNLHAQKQVELKKISAKYNQKTLSTLENKLKEKSSFEKEKALKIAKKKGWDVRFTNKKGELLELQKVVNGKPIYYTTFNVAAAKSTRTNHLNSGGSLGLNLMGQNMIAHVWDGGLARTSHQEYDGAGGTNRFSIGDGTTTLNYHSAHVTGTIIASGVVAKAKGMAPQARAVGYDWNNDTSEATSAASNGMLVSNHSYGFATRNQQGQPQLPDYYFGGYISDSRDWDNVMFNAPNFLMVVAAGNDGNDNSANGTPLNGNSSYDKLSGHATSKNGMVVANANDANIDANGNLLSVTINSSSSEGPTDDYRIKPDITGNGTAVYSTYESSDTAYNSITGTSMASPNVAGTLLILQQHANNVRGSFIKASTLKGIALHTADDAGANGPDAIFGWGLMNAKKAAVAITQNGTESKIEELTLTSGQTYQITVDSDGVNDLMASISWTDRAGVATTKVNSNTAVLVNDLDIRVSKNETTYTPWKLTGVTTNGKGDNTVDPYERVDIANASGTYTIKVTHKGSLIGGSQNYSLIVTGLTGTPTICNATTPTSLTIDNFDSSTATASWSAVTGTSYDFRYRKTGTSTWTNTTTATTSTSLSGLTPKTSYEVQVRSKCINNSTSAYSQSVNFTTKDVQLNYCNSNGNSVNDEYISKVVLGSINNTTGGAPSGYTDYTSQSTNLTKGTSSTITITPTWTGTAYNEGYAVFIDYNKDGDFSDSGETVWTVTTSETTPISGSFTVPTSAITGPTRMRVVMQYNTTPSACNSYDYGETEDYSVNITGAAAVTASTTMLHEAYFESDWSGWSDGGTDCYRYTGTSSYQGNSSIRIRDNSGTESAMTSPTFNLTSYNSVEVEFYFYSYSMENGEDFWLRYYNGSSWTTVAAWASGTNFENDKFYTAKITLNNTDVNFATNTAFRFQNDASNNNDYIYIDQVTIKGIVGNKAAENAINALPTKNIGFTTNNSLFNGDKMVYPNPARDILNINPNFSLISPNYSITNVLGQIIKTGSIKNNAINISTLKKGIYLIKLTDEEETFTQKFIKQ